MKTAILTTVFSISLGLSSGQAFALPRFEVLKLGDVNHNGVIDIDDANQVTAHVLNGAPLAVCPAVADANKDGAVSVSDAVRIIQIVADGIDVNAYVVCAPPREELEALALEPISVPAMVERTEDGESSLTLGHIPIKVFDGPKATGIWLDFYGEAPPEPNGRIVKFRGVTATGECVARGYVISGILMGGMETQIVAFDTDLLSTGIIDSNSGSASISILNPHLGSLTLRVVVDPSGDSICAGSDDGRVIYILQFGGGSQSLDGASEEPAYVRYVRLVGL